MSGPGRLITLEGGEGAGKSTQARRLADWLRARGHDVIETREPGGTPGAEAIRALLLTGGGDRWDIATEALLFAAARADHVARLIRPALAAGRWVISDRYLDSSLAYQGGAGGLGVEAVRTTNALAVGDLRPDLTLLLDLPPEAGARRAAVRDGGDADRIAARGEGYHRQVAAAFHDLADAEPNRFAIVAADADVEAVTERIRAIVAARLPCA